MSEGDLFRLDGCVCVVSGAAGWLGSTFVECLATAGAHVVGAGRDEQALEALAARYRADGLSVEARSCDVTSPAWRDLVIAVARDHGRIDVLVNNAHAGRGGSLRTSTAEDFRQAWEVAVVAAWEGITAARSGFAGSLKAGGSPCVINVASMYGLVSPDFSVYSSEDERNPPFYGSAKAGLLQLTRYAAAELGPEGVRVNALSPGPFPGPRALGDPGFVDALAGKTLLGRVGRPEDLRTAMLFLSSPGSSFVTGTNLVVDGGWTAGR
jgi:NAD(P)-dependent dehydrogenase (short-subunit alcohol dehydrogenase family)